jgi:hypothetical protein
MSNAEQELRDRYLQLWLQVVKDEPNATFHMYGNSIVQGKLCGTDSENNRFRVNQLESPIGTYEKVTLRGTDINRIEWNVQSYDNANKK